MTVPRDISGEMATLITSGTGRPTGVDEVPKEATKPFYNLRTTPGPTMAGSMGDPNSIDRQVYMIDVVGTTREQVEDAEARLLAVVSDMRGSILGVMGPSDLRRNGVGREDDRTYRGMVVVTVSVTGS